MQINPTLIQKALKNVHLLPKHEQIELYEILDELEKRKGQQVSQSELLAFANAVYPGYKVGPHHRKLAKIFEEIAEGKKKRVIVNIAPRHGKSELISYLAPAWFIGKYPHKKVIMASHTADLAVNFGRRVRNLVNSDDYKSVFPDVTLQADSKSASRWGTNKQGEYFAIGVGGALAGRGADLFIIDDPHSEQEAKQLRPDVFLPAWEWFQSGPLQRLMPGGAIIIVMTRWSNFDLTGMIVDYMTKNPDADQWEVVEFPAILNDKPLWPEFWTMEELTAKKASMDVRYWNAQYMQQPTAEEGALIKREWWRVWEEDHPPECEFKIQSWDTAFMKHNRADYSACTTWGVFYTEDETDGKTKPNIILLDAFKDRMEFPELKEVAKKHYHEWNPDAFVVEAKAAGTPLIFELRAIGIPVSEFTPSKGNDKIARVNAVTDLFASGIVWAPDTRWAQEVIEECAAFPAGMHDDYVDSCFVGETSVLMANGAHKRIDSINIGDFVATPNGAQEVLAVLDQGVKPVVQLVTSGGDVYCTPDHRMMTQRGWIRVDKLVPGVDTVVTSTREGPLQCLSSQSKVKHEKLSYLTAGNIIGTRKALAQHIANIFHGLARFYTATFGSFTKALYPMGTMFTTSMGTLPTTASKISHVCPLLTIGESTPKSVVCVANKPNILRILSAFAQKLLSGINLKRGEHGIGNMQSNPLKPLVERKSRKGLRTNLQPVFGAVPVYLQKLLGRNFAGQLAKPQNLGFVEVLEVRPTHTMRQVYDITVANEHCFFANGLLAHNCTQALLRFRKGGFVKLYSDYTDPPKERRRRRGGYY